MDTRRLILVFVFSFSLVMLWEAWQKHNNPQAPLATAPAATATAPVPETSGPAPVSAASVPEGNATAGSTKAEIVKIKTDLFVADVSTLGGTIVGLELNNYKASEDKSRNFSLFDVKHQYAAQSGLIGEGLPNHKTVFAAAPGNRELAADAASVELRLEAPAVDGVKVSKIYTFNRGSYLINVATEINNGGQKEISAHAYYQLQRDTAKPEGESSMVSTYTGPAVYTDQGKYQKINFKDIEKGSPKFVEKADNGWMAMVQHYFVSAWIPQEKQAREFFVRKLEGGANPGVTAGVIVPVATVAPGAKASNVVSLYAGPQIQSMLEQLAKPAAEGGIGAQGLPLVVDYGWLTIVAAPIFWCLQAIHSLVGNWGWAIVLLTVAIKAIFFPLSAASYKSMAKMKAIAPRMTALRERCGDDKQKLNMEMMNLYKTEKINPLGGCLPIAVQIPVFIALYWALLGAVELRDAAWIGWIKDLSAPDTLFGIVNLGFANFHLGPLPLIMMATMLIQTKLNPTPPDPVQARMTKLMPLIFGIMFFNFPSGLVLYWIVNNTLSIAQQWQINRMLGGGGTAANDTKA